MKKPKSSPNITKWNISKQGTQDINENLHFSSVKSGHNVNEVMSYLITAFKKAEGKFYFPKPYNPPTSEKSSCQIS